MAVDCRQIHCFNGTTFCPIITFLAPEKRSKLDDSGIKCRLIGYGDDFGLEEIKGYKVLKEDDVTIFWTDNCVFDMEQAVERLPEVFYSTEVDNIRDELWNPNSESAIDSDESRNESDTPFELDELYTESESSNLVKFLLENNCWTKSKDSSIDDLYVAYRAVTEGTHTTYKEAMKSSEKSQWNTCN